MRSPVLVLVPLLGWLGACGDPDCAASLSFAPPGGVHSSLDLELAAEWTQGSQHDLELTVEADGLPIAGETVAKGAKAHFEPEEPYPDDAVIQLSALVQCPAGPQRVDAQPVRTLPFQQPVAVPGALVGQTYVSPGSGFRVVEPAGDLGALLEDTLHMVWLPMLTVSEVDAAAGTASITMHWADPFVEDVPRQRPCSLPVSMQPASFENPALSIPPTDLGIVTGFGVVQVYDVAVDGRFSSDGQKLGEIAFDGIFDIRDLYLELGYDHPADFCGDAATLGHSCVPCPDGNNTCLSVGMAEVEADVHPVALTDEDVCEIDGHLVLWNEDHLYRADEAAGSVQRVDYDGALGWRVDLGSEIVSLSASPAHEHTPRVTYTGADGLRVRRWIDLDPGDGRTLGEGQSGTARSSIAGLAELSTFLTSGCGVVCSTVPVPVHLFGPTLAALVLVGLRRGDA